MWRPVAWEGAVARMWGVFAATWGAVGGMWRAFAAMWGAVAGMWGVFAATWGVVARMWGTFAATWRAVAVSEMRGAVVSLSGCKMESDITPSSAPGAPHQNNILYWGNQEQSDMCFPKSYNAGYPLHQ